MKAAGLCFVRVAAGVAIAGVALAGAGARCAAAPAPPRLQLANAPAPADGLYEANDTARFVIDHRYGFVRMRFIGSDEVFYLSSEPAPLGGRVLKYDTGEVALQVAGWGAVTLYTEAARSGVPAERADFSDAVDPIPVAASGVKAFAQKLASELASRDDLAVGFAADWDSLGVDEVRGLALDSMRNAAYAVEKAAGGTRRHALARGLHIIKVTPGAKPGALFSHGVLVVSYAPPQGPSARPSSLAILKVLSAGL
jgi:Domain of unknown function (DUF4908)